MSSFVDWGLAERTASAVIAGLPGRDRPSETDPYTEAELREACASAIATAAAYAGLGEVGAPPAAELLSRREWAGNALSALSQAAEPLERRASAELSLPGPLGSIARRGAGAAVGVEAGVAAGYAARRVLGQYDVVILGRERPARLLFVGENLDATRGALGARRDVFLTWIALHETTHVLQFERVPWLVGHLRGLATALVEEAAGGLDGAALAAVGRRIIGEPRQFAAALLRGEAARLLASPAQRRTLDRLQATMSVIEGHAEHVMDAAAADLGPEVGRLRRRVDERRGDRGGLGELIARLLGMDLKLRQYELGKAFCDEIVREGGRGALSALWDSAAALPDLAELEDPHAWLRRTALAPAA